MSARGILAYSILDASILLSDDDDKSKRTRSEAGLRDGDASSTEELDGASHDPASEPVGDGLDLGTTHLPSPRTAADGSKANDDNGNDGITNDEQPVLPTDRRRSASSRDHTSEVVDDGVNSKALLSNQSAADGSDADDHNSNNGTTTNKCSLPTEQQTSVPSHYDSVFDNGGPDEPEDDYIFDIFARDDEGADARSGKRQKLSAVSYRYLSPNSTIISEPYFYQEDVAKNSCDQQRRKRKLATHQTSQAASVLPQYYSKAPP